VKPNWAGWGRLYVLTAPPAAYCLPEDPQYPASAAVRQKGVQPFGYAAVAATLAELVTSWLIRRRQGSVQAPPSEKED